MNDELTLRGFFQRHFLGFIAGIFAAYISIALAISLAFITYFRALPLAESGVYIMLGGAAVTLLVAHGNLMVLWGRPRWVWLLVGVFVSCLGFVLPMAGYAPHRGLYAMAVLFPVLGLLLLQSQRQRDMRNKLVAIRAKREALRGPRS
ncbi:hypothetical protein [Pseudomonas brassicacearum]|jgi:hypothetical protein|uniref:Uncharacterized protein n=1 Tax=Pseudomonas brassicacearum subsp. neoaurantiaca TaxID=494916 RepID=A0A7V8UC23_9PSED|nr:hypothetical protein [Pseudomonas brassicacearum]MBA1377544.1 hypothetical protein [Pseudomonas brassicacearum subsp. neoaurantiaca]